MKYYEMCCKYRGNVVTITDIQGRTHNGRIVDVDERYVYLERTERTNTLGGFGYGYYGGYYGGYGGYPSYGYGRYGYNVFPVALAAIGGFALGAAFFW